MKLTLNKKALKNLSKDSQILPDEVTPQIGGGVLTDNGCPATVACEESFNTCPEDTCGTGSAGCGGGGGGGGGTISGVNSCLC